MSESSSPQSACFGGVHQAIFLRGHLVCGVVVLEIATQENAPMHTLEQVCGLAMIIANICAPSPSHPHEPAGLAAALWQVPSCTPEVELRDIKESI